PHRRLGRRGDGPPAGEQRPDPDGDDHLGRAHRGRRPVRRGHRVPDAGQGHVLGDRMSKSVALIAGAVLVATPAHAAEGGGPLTVEGGLMFWTLVVFAL